MSDAKYNIDLYSDAKYKTFIDVYSNGSSTYFIFLPVVMPLMYNYIYDNSLNKSLQTRLVYSSIIQTYSEPVPSVYSSIIQTYSEPVPSVYTTDTINFIVNRGHNLITWLNSNSLNKPVRINKTAADAYKKFRGTPEYNKLLSSNWIDTVYANKTLPVIQKAAQNDADGITTRIPPVQIVIIIIIFILIVVYMWIRFPTQYQHYFFEDAPEFTIYIITLIWLYVAYMLTLALPSILFNKIDSVEYPIFYRNQINIKRSDVPELFTNIKPVHSFDWLNRIISKQYITNDEIKVKRNLNIQ